MTRHKGNPNRPRLNAHQFNIKLTEQEHEMVMQFNQKLFGGFLNNCDLGRLLLKAGVEALKDAKVGTVFTVNGKIIDQ